MPGRILSEGDRLERLFFGGFDPLLRRRRGSPPLEREDCSPQLWPLVRNVFVKNSDPIAHKWFCQKTSRLLRPITPQ
jgi:hypothetical protein